MARTQQRLLRKLVGSVYVMHFDVARCARARKILCNGQLHKSLRKGKRCWEKILIHVTLLYMIGGPSGKKIVASKFHDKTSSGEWDFLLSIALIGCLGYKLSMKSLLGYKPKGRKM